MSDSTAEWVLKLPTPEQELVPSVFVRPRSWIRAIRLKAGAEILLLASNK